MRPEDLRFWGGSRQGVPTADARYKDFIFKYIQMHLRKTWRKFLQAETQHTTKGPEQHDCVVYTTIYIYISIVYTYTYTYTYAYTYTYTYTYTYAYTYTYIYISVCTIMYNCVQICYLRLRMCTDVYIYIIVRVYNICIYSKLCSSIVLHVTMYVNLYIICILHIYYIRIHV